MKFFPDLSFSFFVAFCSFAIHCLSATCRHSPSTTISRVPAHFFLQSQCSSSATASYRTLVRCFCRTKSSLCFEEEGGRAGPEQNKINNNIKYITKRRGHFIPVFIFPGKWPYSLCSSPLLKLAVSQSHQSWLLLRRTAGKTHRRILLFLRQQNQFRTCKKNLPLLPWAALLLGAGTLQQWSASPANTAVLEEQ